MKPAPFAVAFFAAVMTAAPASAKPTSTDQLMVWRLFQPAAAPPAGIYTNDVTFYLTKQLWLDDTWGIFAFYSPANAATLRGMSRMKWEDLTIVGMAGARWISMTGSLALFTDKFHEGPEAAIILSHPICPCSKITVSAMFSGAYLLEANKTLGEPKTLYFYAFNINWPPFLDSGTAVSAGFMGSILSGVTSGQKFHDIGPTLTVSHSY